MKKNALTLTVVANMTSNYSEGLGNISSVQKIYRDRNDDGIYARQGFGNVLVEAVVQRVAVVGLEAGGIDEDELGGVVGVDAGYFVARGLCFFAGDADFLPDEVVHQGGFADVQRDRKSVV